MSEAGRAEAAADAIMRVVQDAPVGRTRLARGRRRQRLRVGGGAGAGRQGSADHADGVDPGRPGPGGTGRPREVDRGRIVSVLGARARWASALGVAVAAAPGAARMALRLA